MSVESTPPRRLARPFVIAVAVVVAVVLARGTGGQEPDEPPTPAMATAPSPSTTRLKAGGASPPLSSTVDQQAQPPPDPQGGFCDGQDHAPGYTPPDPWRAVEEHLQRVTATPLPAKTRDALDSVARASREKAHPARMFDVLVQAVEDAPLVAALHAWLGMVSLGLGRPFAGLRAMDVAARALPDVHAWWKPRAELMALAGQVTPAAQLMARYAAREPGDWAATRRARLMEVQADVEADFVVMADARFPTRYSPQVPVERARAILDALRGAEPRIAAVMGPLPDAVSVVVYAERADLLACTCAQGWSTAVFDGRMRFQDEPGGPLRNADVLVKVSTHELVHAFQRRAGMRRDGWLVEGTARYLAAEEDASYARRVKQLGQSGAYIPFSSMMGTLQELEDQEDSGLAYDQSLMMVHWVVETAGVEGLQRLVRVPAERDGVAALSGVLGTTADQLGPAFARWLAQR